MQDRCIVRRQIQDMAQGQVGRGKPAGLQGFDGIAMQLLRQIGLHALF
jgi:hypothetical protein